MKGIKELREKLGLKQVDLAGLLGIQRPLLNMVEKHIRSLPAEACVRFSNIQQTLTKEAEEICDGIPDKGLKKVGHAMNKRYQNIQFKLAGQRRRLAQLEEMYAKKQYLLNVLKHLEDNDKIDPDWINAIDKKTRKSLSCCTPAITNILKDKIRILEAEAEQIRSTGLVSDCTVI